MNAHATSQSVTFAILFYKHLHYNTVYLFIVSPILKTVLQIRLHFHQLPARTALLLFLRISSCLQMIGHQQPLKTATVPNKTVHFSSTVHTHLAFSPPGCWKQAICPASVSYLFIYFQRFPSDHNYLKIYQTDLSWIARTMAVHDQSEIRFPIPQRKLPWELFFVVAGHRWLVAQPGGLTLHFAVQLADLVKKNDRSRLSLHIIWWTVSNTEYSWRSEHGHDKWKITPSLGSDFTIHQLTVARRRLHALF